MIDVAHCQLVEGTQSVVSSHKLDHIYDRENSATFFYSEVEKCWVVIVNNGTISVDGIVLSPSGNRSSVIEHRADVVFGGRSFIFYNINSPKGMSRILVDALLKSKREKIKTEKILRVIQDSCSLYKDLYFVLDCVLKNDIFDYRSGELSLNAETLRKFIKAGKSPVKNALEYEFEHGFRSRSMGRSFNVNKIWCSPEFGIPTDEKPKAGVRWPTPKELDAALEKKVSGLDTAMESSTADCKTDLLPSPRSSCRYINSYVVESLQRDKTGTNGRKLEQHRPSNANVNPSSPGTSSSSNESTYDEDMHTASEDSDQSASSRSDMIILKRRPSPAPCNKKCKYYLEPWNKPAVERLAVSGESDSVSTVLGSDSEIERVRSKPKLHPRSASCVEDGFMCDKNAGLLGDLVSHGKKRRVYKIKALSCYDVYKINKL